MDIFKDLPLDLQLEIFDIYKTERKLDLIEKLQKENYKDLIYEFNHYQTVFYKEEHDDWSTDLLFFTLRYEMQNNMVYSSIMLRL